MMLLTTRVLKSKNVNYSQTVGFQSAVSGPAMLISITWNLLEMQIPGPNKDQPSQICWYRKQSAFTAPGDSDHRQV